MAVTKRTGQWPAQATMNFDSLLEPEEIQVKIDMSLGGNYGGPNFWVEEINKIERIDVCA